MEQTGVYRVTDALELPEDATLEKELDRIGSAMDSERDNIRYARLLASIARSLARIEANMREGGF